MSDKAWNKVFTAAALVMGCGCGARAYAETSNNGEFFFYLVLGTFIMHGALGGLKEFMRD